MRGRIPNHSDLFKGTPLNLDQTNSLGLDLDLDFLNGFVEEQTAKGLPSYDPQKSLSAESAAVTTSHLNFKAYEQEMPRISTINQPYGATVSSQPSQPKETLKNVPVFNHPSAYQTSGAIDTNLKVNNVKQVWGAQPDPASQKPGEVGPNVAANIQNRVQEANRWQSKKKEEPKPVVDEKKEAMKNALFGGIK